MGTVHRPYPRIDTIVISFPLQPIGPDDPAMDPAPKKRKGSSRAGDSPPGKKAKVSMHATALQDSPMKSDKWDGTRANAMI